MRSVVVAACAALTVGLTACVGPATTDDAYHGKALHAAHDAISQLQTAHLTVETMLRGRLQHLYTESVLSSTEDAVSSIQQSFDSIQPPHSKKSDDLRDNLDPLLSNGADSVRELRIAARRHDDATLRSVLDDLQTTIGKIDTFASQNK